jgi:hypothetical protein
VGDGDSPLGEEILDVSEAEAKAMANPDGVTDNRRWKVVAMVAEHGDCTGLLWQPRLKLTMSAEAPARDRCLVSDAGAVSV